MVQYSKNGSSFNIEAVREFLSTAHKYVKTNLSEEEKVSEISTRRNSIEKGLRLLTRNTLITEYGKKKASSQAVASLPPARGEKFQSVRIDQLLDRDKSELFFLEVTNLIMREWDAFKNVFDMEKDSLRLILTDFNQSGRPDAHAKL